MIQFQPKFTIICKDLSRAKNMSDFNFQLLQRGRDRVKVFFHRIHDFLVKTMTKNFGLAFSVVCDR